MTTLDHTAFPHILDAILTNAPRRVLLTFRATSQHLRSLADNILCANADLHLTATASWSLTSASGALPLLPGDTRASCLSAIKTLTLRMPPSQRRMARKDLLLPALYLSATTLRLPDPFLRLSIDGLAPLAEELIVFERITPSFNCDKTGWFFPPTISGTRIPTWAKRYVLNIAVRPEEPELHAATWDAWAVVDEDGRPQSLNDDREVVVILHGLPGRPARSLQVAQHELGILHGLAEAVAAHPWKWTVVGVPEMLKVAPHAVAAQDFASRFNEVAGRENDFCSMAQYERLRGPRAVLETDVRTSSTSWME
ncbi:hypothetical protein CcaverHIS002_0607700 [Cutaneotrichosporon cavernicola]|uniref:F-box domain-containing protein n=1 Tax=Cutaneotrichosporon cavernicola TaxID=279322 RepID=A0AA48L989_9TREE|nr:uncharacterized protein CcaverHIS019_0607140 [Cutaneotrichosporon cavernicola]BEI86483.1 hypothetical protein CcaverHIS002_0607700 [Cutaneotrichosporon cavernicola]BEI94255.1 hypothetical protein CcaverHIS019_0607140 [Cutaneotrichosporon cavernicola]